MSEENGNSPIISFAIFKDSIVFENNDLLVLNKPGWLVCHPSKRGPWSSLVGAARAYLGQGSIHLVSRLDRETSGLVLIAKNKSTASIWQKGCALKRVQREYIALLSGELRSSYRVELPIGKACDSLVFVKQAITSELEGKLSITQFDPLEYRFGNTRCRVKTETGRMHQIRVHAQHIGYPIIGDKLYGEDESYYLEFIKTGWNPLWKGILKINRQALHANKITRYSSTGEVEQTFSIGLPTDLHSFWENGFA